MASAVLAEGAFHPDPAIDMWQFGMFIVDQMGGYLPEAHTALCTSAAWKEAKALVLARQSIDLDDLPIMVSHLQYLQDLAASEVDYASQVRVDITMSCPYTCVLTCWLDCEGLT